MAADPVFQLKETIEARYREACKAFQAEFDIDDEHLNIEEDALRRDFRVNALYYDISDFSVRDYVDVGNNDPEHRVLHASIVDHGFDIVHLAKAHLHVISGEKSESPLMITNVLTCDLV